MLTLRRRKHTRSAVSPLNASQVLVWHNDKTVRFFFKEQLIPMGGHDEITRQQFSRLGRAINALPGVVSVRPHRHYLAVSWQTRDMLEFSTREIAQMTEQGSLTLLSRYFGWPTRFDVATIDSFEQYHELQEEAQRVGLNWKLGRG